MLSPRYLYFFLFVFTVLSLKGKHAQQSTHLSYQFRLITSNQGQGFQYCAKNKTDKKEDPKQCQMWYSTYFSVCWMFKFGNLKIKSSICFKWQTKDEDVLVSFTGWEKFGTYQHGYASHSLSSLSKRKKQQGMVEACRHQIPAITIMVESETTLFLLLGLSWCSAPITLQLPANNFCERETRHYSITPLFLKLPPCIFPVLHIYCCFCSTFKVELFLRDMITT